MQTSQLTSSQSSSQDKPVRWNKSQEAAAKRIGESAKGLKIMHINVARTTSRIYECLMIVSIVLGPAAGTMDVIGSAYPDSVEIFLIISATISFLSGILIAVVKFASLDEESIAHKTAAAQYTSLESNVRRQLALYRDNRPNPEKYLTWITDRYDELFASSPLIPRRVQDAYVTHARERGITIPDQIESVIEVNTEYQECKLKEMSNTQAIQITSRDSTVERDLEDGVLAESAEPVATPSPDVTLRASEGGSTSTTKRKKVNAQYANLGEFSDGMMNYQLSRLFNFDE